MSVRPLRMPCFFSALRLSATYSSPRSRRAVISPTESASIPSRWLVLRIGLLSPRRIEDRLIGGGGAGSKSRRRRADFERHILLFVDLFQRPLRRFRQEQDRDQGERDRGQKDHDRRSMRAEAVVEDAFQRQRHRARQGREDISERRG